MTLNRSKLIFSVSLYFMLLMMLVQGFRGHIPSLPVLRGGSYKLNPGVSNIFRRMSTSNSAQHDITRPQDHSNAIDVKTPITVLSGFLGAGKTTFLQRILNANQTKKYGLVVNDVASVNVDSKLIRQQTAKDGIDTIELQNGCVCCSLAEDLLASVANLVSVSESKGSKYDHIIVECSGIAEPRKMRDLFQEAEDYDSPLLYNIKLDTLVTVVDAKIFFDTFGSEINIKTKSELAYRPNDDEGNKALSGDAGSRLVTELLLEQVECADVVIINKCDLLSSDDEVKLVEKVIYKMNPTAKVITCVKGEVPDPTLILGIAKGDGAAFSGILDEHRKLIEALEKENQSICKVEGCNNPSHAHHNENDCRAPNCNDPSHNHDHHEKVCNEANCNDPSHKHDHKKGYTEAKCTDPSHNHDHNHSHDNVGHESCSDIKCTDPSHNHDHKHDHSHRKTTAEERFGITSFIYKRRKPFHPIRLSNFLQSLGKLSIKGISDVALSDFKETDSNSLYVARKTLLRSKGFVWMASSKSTVYYWSHAGQYVEMNMLGQWWADISEEDWPAELRDEIMKDFNGSEGDRRQELVFIGQFDEKNSKESLESILDSCLVTDEEMKTYSKLAPKGDDALRNAFFNINPKSDFDQYVETIESQK